MIKEIDTKDNGLMMNITVLEYITINLEVNIRVNGKMAVKMEKELQIKLVLAAMENLKITNIMDGGFIEI